MKVLKFGGTSVGSADRIKHVKMLVDCPNPKIVVLSAMSGTTNSLVAIAEALYKKDTDEANRLIDELYQKYEQVVADLYDIEEAKQKGKDLIQYHFDHLRSFTQDLFTLYEERAVLAQGELISTALFHYYLEEQGLKSELIPALDFMRINKDEEPDMEYISKHLKEELAKYPDNIIFVTQGYICRNAYGEIDNLKRGGSDYTASLIGAAIDLKEIQIWTDIDGMHNNDPRIVENTKPIARLSFDEAAELAYFGAKILHPSSVHPAHLKNIPVRLLNTMKPDAEGTTISKENSEGEIKAVAAKDGIVAIKIKSGRMLLAYGFLRNVFEVFERYKTPIDMITTSEVAVSLTIDKTENLKEIVEELEKFGVVEVDDQQSIICVVGDFVAEKEGFATRIFDSLKNIPIRMISYGGSRHNISMLVSTDQKENALKALHQGLFQN